MTLCSTLTTPIPPRTHISCTHHPYKTQTHQRTTKTLHSTMGNQVTYSPHPHSTGNQGITALTAPMIHASTAYIPQLYPSPTPHITTHGPQEFLIFITHTPGICQTHSEPMPKPTHTAICYMDQCTLHRQHKLCAYTPYAAVTSQHPFYTRSS